MAIRIVLSLVWYTCPVPGMFVDGYVAVTGISPGTAVVVPS